MADSTALQARPTTYKGVAMRSRLEAAWAEQFDAWDVPWEYEPRCFASSAGQYLPDFRFPTNPTPHFVEVKPWIDGEQVVQVLSVGWDGRYASWPISNAQSTPVPSLHAKGFI